MIIIDVPSPFGTLKEWQSFRDEMQALIESSEHDGDDLDEIRAALDEADQAIKKLEVGE